MKWKDDWERYLVEAKRDDTRLVPTGCRLVKRTTNREAYLKKKAQADGGGEEPRIKVKTTTIQDCSAQLVKVKPAPSRATADTDLEESESEAPNIVPVAPGTTALVRELGLSERMSQGEQEELIAAETERLERELSKGRKRRGLRIRIGKRHVGP